MEPQEILDRAMEMLTLPEFEPVIAKAFDNAVDIPTAAATLVGPIIIKIMQDFDVPEEELFGNEEGDGIATYLIAELFDIAGEAGYLPPEGTEDEAIAMGEKAADILKDIIEEADTAQVSRRGPVQNQPQAPAPQNAGLLGG